MFSRRGVEKETISFLRSMAAMTQTRREAYLEKLAGRMDDAWRNVHALFGRKKDGRALRLILDLRAAADLVGDSVGFLAHLRELDDAFVRRQTLSGMPSRRVAKDQGKPARENAPAGTGAGEPCQDASEAPKTAKKSRKKSPADADWVEAKKRCRLNAETIQMAKELGMTPRSLIKNIPAGNQQWKAPVHAWIRDMHAKRFGRPAEEKPRRRDAARELEDDNRSSRLSYCDALDDSEVFPDADGEISEIPF